MTFESAVFGWAVFGEAVYGSTYDPEPVILDLNASGSQTISATTTGTKEISL